MLQLLLVLVILSLCLQPCEECDLLSTLFVYYVMPSAKRAKKDLPLSLVSRMWREETKIRKLIYNFAKDIRTSNKIFPRFIIITTTTTTPYKSRTLKYLQTEKKNPRIKLDKFKFMKNLYLYLLRAKWNIPRSGSVEEAALKIYIFA